MPPLNSGVSCPIKVYGMTQEVFWLSVLYSLLATVVGGCILALIFFWLKENAFPLPQVGGRWFFEMTTLETSYNPYRGMVLRYEAMLWSEGSRVSGTVEKIYENSSTGERSFVATNRTRGVVDGVIEKRYFSKDLVTLHVVEDGHGRESTNLYQLVVEKDGFMTGSFSSMVAKQDGTARWQRNRF